MSRFFKLLGLFFLITGIELVNPAYASQWVYLTTSQDGSLFYIDFDSIKGTGSQRTFWSRKDSTNGITRLLAKWIVNCDFQQMGMVEAIEYYSDGSVRSHYKADESIGGGSELIPGTIGEAQYDYICSKIHHQPQSVQPPATIAASQYPKAQCGDPYPSIFGEYQIYAVFADYSPEMLNYIQVKLCSDAFPVRRENGILSIQVASFYSKDSASKFASFLREQVGNSEIGQPKTVFIYPSK